MYKRKLTPEEALEAIKLRMNYDLSKTLNENSNLNEQRKVSPSTQIPVSADFLQNLTSQTRAKIACINFGPLNYITIKDADSKLNFKFYRNGRFIDSMGDKGSYECMETDSSKVYVFYDENEDWNGAVKLSQTKKTQNKAKPIEIPKELKDIEGVKNFQNWLDEKYAGWHDKYKVLAKNVQKGFGKFGPRTQKWWKEKGQEYLKSLTQTTTSDTGPTDTGPSANGDTKTTQVATTTPVTPQTTSTFKADPTKGFQQFAQSQLGSTKQTTNRVAGPDTEF